MTDFPVTKTDDEWRQILTAEQYQILRKHATERPGSCALNTEKRAGTFFCAGCSQALFTNDTKFESGTGWPSFFAPLNKENVAEKEDRSWFSTRTEVLCARCEAHLGHVFDDGPQPTGLRYCMNGTALDLQKK